MRVPCISMPHFTAVTKEYTENVNVRMRLLLKCNSKRCKNSISGSHILIILCNVAKVNMLWFTEAGVSR